VGLLVNHGRQFVGGILITTRKLFQERCYVCRDGFHVVPQAALTIVQPRSGAGDSTPLLARFSIFVDAFSQK